MIISHFNLKNKQQNLRLALVVLALVAAIVGALWAQDDTPITISDGSLTIESSGFAWTSWGNSGARKTHPAAGRKAVPQVDITLAGVIQPPVPCSGQRCIVDVTYLTTNVNIDSGPNGRNLSVGTNFSSFHSGATPNHLAHNNPNGKISHVTVKQGNVTRFDQAVPANSTRKTMIVIHYR